MKSKIIKLCMYISTIITAIFMIASHIFNSINVLKCLSTIATISECIVFIYCKWLWRVKTLNLWKIKDLNGEWECILKYNYNNENKEKITRITIKQDLFGIQVNMISNETNSWSIVASIERDHDREYLVYAYKTETKPEYRELNRDQLGAVKLMIKDVRNMEGEYWTNNKTVGTMFLKKI